MKKILNFQNAIILFSLLMVGITSCKKEPVLPTITTTYVTEISTFSAVSGGNISSDGGASIIDQGICWHTSPLPTIENSKASGMGSNPFTASLTGLLPNTAYYVRAYAVNSAGVSYGNSALFKTIGDTPGIKMENVTGITMNSAETGATINPNYLPTVVTIEYGENTTYGSTLTITDTPLTGNTDIKINKTLTGLNQLTIYHYRYKATNQLGTKASEDMTLCTFGTVSDVDGNSYKTIRIGNQVWMAENLRTTHFPDGVPILNGEDVANFCDGKAYYFRFNKDPIMAEKHGLLYNYYAATHSTTLEPDYSNTVPGEIQGACPTGWHLPTFPEFGILIDHLGGEAVAGGKLKTIELWNYPNKGATNSSNFSALPSGLYDKLNYGYGHLGAITGYWSSTGSLVYFKVMHLEYQSEGASKNFVNHRCNGTSVRCIRN